MRQDPLWWADARKMLAEGNTIANISRALGFDKNTVKYAVNDAYKAQKLAARKQYEKRRTEPNNARNQMLKYARDEAAETGGHIDAILMAWGDQPRTHWKRKKSS